MENRVLPSPIAIDGPAASGKSSVGRALAADPGYRFLDTGLMYRAFTLRALRVRVAPDNEALLHRLASQTWMSVVPGQAMRIAVDGEDVTDLLTGAEVEANVSHFSKVPVVREAMVSLQREFAEDGPIILAGRDIGTVVLPDAPLKFYLDAKEEARAVRRGLEGRGTDAARANVAERDRIDSTRTISPLAIASDAIVIDTTEMDLETVIEFVRGEIRARTRS